MLSPPSQNLTFAGPGHWAAQPGEGHPSAGVGLAGCGQGWLVSSWGSGTTRGRPCWGGAGLITLTWFLSSFDCASESTQAHGRTQLFLKEVGACSEISGRQARVLGSSLLIRQWNTCRADLDFPLLEGTGQPPWRGSGELQECLTKGKSSQEFL